MSRVFVVDAQRHPLYPCTPARARLLLKQQKAAVLRKFPFTLILKDVMHHAITAPLRVKIDPGAKTTGLAVVDDATGEVVWAAELTHRGHQIREALTKRRLIRRSRRQRHTRYRPARFQNRRRSKGWLPPSLLSRLTNIFTWVTRLQHFCPIDAISLEVVKFDLALLQHPDLSGADYQQGTLLGMEIRAYLLVKWDYCCAYCKTRNGPLELDHLVPKSRGGSNRVSNLVIACHACNQAKGNRSIEELLVDQPNVFHCLLTQMKAPLRDAAAMNTTRWALYKRLQATGLLLEMGTGGRTAWNRARQNVPKEHWIDASCVGASTPEQLHLQHVRPLLIIATGRQRRQMCLVDQFGFPRTKPKQSSSVQSFRTGDLAKAVVIHGKKVGIYQGRVAVRATGYFNITTKAGTVQGIPARCFSTIHHADGYTYF
jgi:5-methylcytosine-specific restriction endonuclease McrA